MRRLYAAVAVLFLSASLCFSITDTEKKKLVDKYLSGGSFSTEELTKLTEIRDSYSRSNVKKAERPATEKDPAGASLQSPPAGGEKDTFFNKYYFGGANPPYDPGVAELRLFGTEYFQSPTTYAPLDNIPVNDSYILGPGDTVMISLWGSSNKQYEVTVNTNGNISAPELGRIPVAGMSFGDLKRYLSRELSEGSDIELALSAIKTIRIFITGDARHPGSYTISGLSGIINAVFASGGPQPTGSLRNIKLKRNGATIRNFDMYSFLLNGDSSSDTYLFPGDVIFIPPAGKLVAVSGNVRRPSIYEAASGETLADLIEIAGGLTASALDTDIFIERFEKNKGKVVLTVNAGNTALSEISLKDGDIVKIFPVPETREDANSVRLTGYVSAPRKFQFTPGMTFSDIVDGEMLLHKTYMKYATVKRKQYPENTDEMISVDLYSAVILKDAEADILLKPEDIITLYSMDEMTDSFPVFILGEVREPGTYEFMPGMTALDLIHKAKGLTNTANLQNGEHVTLVMTGDRVESVSINDFSPAAVFEYPYDSNTNFQLSPFDKIFIRKVANFEENRAIALRGEVTYPGTYFAENDDRLYDILKRAGGFTERAYPRAIIFTRRSVRETQQKRLDDLIASLETGIETLTEQKENYAEAAAMISLYRSRIEKLRSSEPNGRLVIEIPEDIEKLKDSPYNVAIMDGDVLQVPITPDSIIVMGEVNNPGTFVYDSRKNRVKDYLRMTGGATSRGDLSKAFVIKAGGKIISRYYIDDESRTVTMFRNKLLNSRIFPGDTVIVPVRDFRVPWVQHLKDWTTILYQLASTVKITSDVWTE